MTTETGSPFRARYEAMDAVVKRLYPKLEAGHAELLASCAAAIEQSEERLEIALAAFYNADSAECARVCDEVLDPSGKLLGLVREWAK